MRPRSRGRYAFCCPTQPAAITFFLPSPLQYASPRPLDSSAKNAEPCLAPRTRGGEGRIRTSEGMTQQIYSLPRLTASVPLHAARCADENSGAGDSETHARSRIRDPAPENAAQKRGTCPDPPRRCPDPPRHPSRCFEPVAYRRVRRPSLVRVNRASRLFVPDSEMNSPGLELARGLEPVTCGLQIRRSTS